MKGSKYNILEKIDDKLVLYNTNSSGILSLNEEYSKALVKLLSENHCEKNDLIKELKRGGMIVDNELNESDNLKLNSMAARYSTNNLMLTIAPTLECNFACPYCYEEGYRRDTMNENVQEELLKFIKDHSKALTSLGIAWYGGEPLIALDTIERLTKSILNILDEKIKYSSTIVTNGYMLTKEVAQKLRELKIERVQVTIDGTREIHDSRRYLLNKMGTFDRIIKNVKDSCNEIPIVIRINVDKSNVGKLDNLLECFEEEDLKGKIFFYLAPVDNINEACVKTDCLTISDFSSEEILFYKAALNRGFNVISIPSSNPAICGAVSLNSFVIDPKGDLYKCWNHIGHENEKVGTIFNNNLNSNIHKWLLYDPFFEEECRECNFLPACMGGCPYTKIIRGHNKCKPIRYNAIDSLRLLQLSKKEI